MNYQEAKALLIYEGLSEEGLPVCVRSNTDPGRHRMMQIIDAIDTLTENENMQGPIDRSIAYALLSICLETNVQSYSWQATAQWRNGAFNDDLSMVQERISKYFEGAPEAA